MSDRRRILFGSRIVLPDGYVPLKYISSSLKQYINTQFSPNAKTKVKVVARKVSGTQGQFSAILGTQNMQNGTKSFLVFFPYTDGHISARVSDGSDSMTSPVTDDFLIRTIKVELNKLEVDGVTTVGATNLTANLRSFYIFARNLNNSPLTASYSRAELYRIEIVDDNALARDYVPALRVSDNKPGLFDLASSICSITGTSFYVNNGDGEFGYETLAGVYVPPI